MIEYNTDNVHKKIALCFLTIGNVSKPELWYNQYSKNKDKFNIYIHNKNRFVCEKTKFHNYAMNTNIVTKWADISLVIAMISLLKKAYNSDERNEWFIFLSDSCIPLYPLDEIYKKISGHSKPIICCSNEFEQGRYSSLQHKFCSANEFKKQHQWCMLTRDFVQHILTNSSEYIKWFGNKVFAPDEHYFINVCKYNKFDYTNQMMTYVNWNEPSDLIKHRRRPKTYVNSLTNEVIDNIKKSHPTALFIRKIVSETKLPSYFNDLNK